MSGFPPNYLAQALAATNPVNPFGPPQPPNFGLRAPGMRLTPMPGLPASFGAFPPQAGARNHHAGAKAAGPMAPPVVPPVPPPPTLEQQAQGMSNELAANQLYQAQPQTYAPPPVSQNPKGDAISAGIQMLAAALAPRIAPGIDRGMAEQQKLRDADYQRRAQESRTAFEDANAAEQEKVKASAAHESMLENRLGLNLQQQQIKANDDLRRQAEAEKERLDKARILHMIRQDSTSTARVREQSVRDANNFGIKNKELAFQINNAAQKNLLTLQGMNLHADTAVQIANSRISAQLLIEKAKEMGLDRRADYHGAVEQSIAGLRAYSDHMNALLKVGNSANASTAVQALSDGMMAPGKNGELSKWDQFTGTLARAGVPVPTSSLSQDYQEGADGQEPAATTTAPAAGGGTTNVYVNGSGGAGAASGGGGGAYGWGSPASGVGAFPPVNPKWSAAMTTSEQANGLPSGILQAMMGQESSGNPHATSSAGAMGLLQLEPGTARDMGVTDPYDPLQSIGGGGKYLGQLLHRYGNLPAALAAYNAGMGNYDAVHGDISKLKPQTQAYVPQVMARWQQILSNPQPTAQVAGATTSPAGPTKPTQPAPVGAITAEDAMRLKDTAKQYHDAYAAQGFDAAWGALSQKMQATKQFSPQEMHAAENDLRHAFGSSAAPTMPKPPAARDFTDLPPQPEPAPPPSPAAFIRDALARQGPGGVSEIDPRQLLAKQVSTQYGIPFSAAEKMVAAYARLPMVGPPAPLPPESAEEAMRNGT